MSSSDFLSTRDTSEWRTLTVQVEVLGKSVDKWNSAMIGALVLTAIAAIAVVVTTRIALSRAQTLADAQARIVAAKDRELSIALKEKDLQIAEAKAQAAVAALELQRFRSSRRLTSTQLEVIR